MLAKRNRVPRALFPPFSKGTTFVSGNMNVKVVTYGDSRIEPTRFSFVISSKAVKKACQRHVFRRVGYAALSKEFPKLKNGFIAVFFIKKSASTLSREAFQAEILTLLKKAKLYQ